ncbi:hypothetical protein GBAR_LOCUS13355 [Geodia barretti]|uniref:Uncharacterized protein n=1 Tax=Geodia barretti TaxID=519541 RepID=A0AA35WIK8_GEOBA|nr:hypothetical protein GBAR_LOCUS13355 [Geodia barretti]
MEEFEEKIKIANQKQLPVVMIIGSIMPPPSSGRRSSVVVHQTPADLSESDRQVLKGLGIPPDKWNNLNALWALHNKTKRGVFSVQFLHYYGNSQRNTGDWSFRDGFITFRDIADLYMKHRP